MWERFVWLLVATLALAVANSNDCSVPALPAFPEGWVLATFRNGSTVFMISNRNDTEFTRTCRLHSAAFGGASWQEHFSFLCVHVADMVIKKINGTDILITFDTYGGRWEARYLNNGTYTHFFHAGAFLPVFGLSGNDSGESLRVGSSEIALIHFPLMDPIADIVIADTDNHCLRLLKWGPLEARTWSFPAKNGSGSQLEPCDPSPPNLQTRSLAFPRALSSYKDTLYVWCSDERLAGGIFVFTGPNTGMDFVFKHFSQSGVFLSGEGATLDADDIGLVLMSGVTGLYISLAGALVSQTAESQVLPSLAPFASAFLLSSSYTVVFNATLDYRYGFHNSECVPASNSTPVPGITTQQPPGSPTATTQSPSDTAVSDTWQSESTDASETHLPTATPPPSTSDDGDIQSPQCSGALTPFTLPTFPTGFVATTFFDGTTLYITIGRKEPDRSCDVYKAAVGDAGWTQLFNVFCNHITRMVPARLGGVESFVFFNMGHWWAQNLDGLSGRGGGPLFDPLFGNTDDPIRVGGPDIDMVHFNVVEEDAVIADTSNHCLRILQWKVAGATAVKFQAVHEFTGAGLEDCDPSPSDLSNRTLVFPRAIATNRLSLYVWCSAERLANGIFVFSGEIGGTIRFVYMPFMQTYNFGTGEGANLDATNDGFLLLTPAVSLFIQPSSGTGFATTALPAGTWQPGGGLLVSTSTFAVIRNATSASTTGSIATSCTNGTTDSGTPAPTSVQDTTAPTEPQEGQQVTCISESVQSFEVPISDSIWSFQSRDYVADVANFLSHSASGGFVTHRVALNSSTITIGQARATSLFNVSVLAEGADVTRIYVYFEGAEGRLTDDETTISLNAALFNDYGYVDGTMGPGGTTRFGGPHVTMRAPLGDSTFGDIDRLAVDRSNHCIRAIRHGQAGIPVTTISGVGRQSGSADGTTDARFNNPFAADFDGDVVYVVDDNGIRVLRRDATGVVTVTTPVPFQGLTSIFDIRWIVPLPNTEFVIGSPRSVFFASPHRGHPYVERIKGYGESLPVKAVVPFYRTEPGPASGARVVYFNSSVGSAGIYSIDHITLGNQGACPAAPGESSTPSPPDESGAPTDNQVPTPEPTPVPDNSSNTQANPQAPAPDESAGLSTTVTVVIALVVVLVVTAGIAALIIVRYKMSQENNNDNNMAASQRQGGGSNNRSTMSSRSTGAKHGSVANRSSRYAANDPEEDAFDDLAAMPSHADHATIDIDTGVGVSPNRRRYRRSADDFDFETEEREMEPMGTDSQMATTNSTSNGTLRKSTRTQELMTQQSTNSESPPSTSRSNVPTAKRLAVSSRQLGTSSSAEFIPGNQRTVDQALETGSAGATKTSVTNEESAGYLSAQQMIKDAAFTRLRLIGRGAFGSVYNCVLDDGQVVAMKEMLLPEDAETKLKEIMAEVDLVSKLAHPNVVRYFGCRFERKEQKMLLFMELAAGGSLATIARQAHKRLGESTAQRYFRQVLEALSYIHSRGVVHRDLKCDNVLLSQDGQCKLGDFGTSRVMQNNTQGATAMANTMIGTPLFMAPEMLNESPDENGQVGYTKKADIWSFGILCLEFMNRGNAPWPTFSNQGAALLYIASGRGKPIIPDGVSDEFRNFIGRCCERDPAKRATAAELLQHPWLESIAFSSIA